MGSAPLPALLDRRLVFVTGKGGVGKSTVAAALGVLAAAAGRRTIIAELARRDDVMRSLGVVDAAAWATGAATSTNGAGGADDAYDGAAGREVQLIEGLSAISIDPDLAMEEYLVDQLPLRAIAERLASSRTFAYLAAATPGLRELLAMGKVWELAQDRRRVDGGEPYDLVVVDAPATGHGLGLLTAGRTFAAAASVGPLARQARIIQEAVDDPAASALVVVARATETCVGETAELLEGLSARLGRGADAVICNGIEPRRFSGADEAALAAAAQRTAAAHDPLVTDALRAARHAARRAAVQRAQLARLRRMTQPTAISLPHVFADRLGRPEIERLARRLQRGLLR